MEGQESAESVWRQAGQFEATEDRQGGEAGEEAEVVPTRPWWVIEGWSGMMDRRLWA